MAKNRRLGTHTTVTNPETGEATTFEPGTYESDLPDWAAKRINNESAWATPLDPDSLESVDPAYTGDYADHTVPELVDMARERQLDIQSTKKSDLIDLLTGADEDASNN